jgi:two-component system chemotaxis response regulator CheY
MNDIAGDTLLKLPEILDLTAAENFLETVRQHASANTLCMDASDVRVLTVPCVQILLAAARSHAAMSIAQPSDAFVGAFEDLGIDWMQDLKVSVAPPLAGENISAEEEGSSNESAEAANAVVQPELNQISEKAMSKRILTIDDSKTMRDMLMLTLAEAGFDVVQAVDGQDGLDVLEGMQGKPDVIITDINMPRMDGYEVIRNLRKNPAHKSTPILVLTTESETEKKNLAREAGATGWMVKPFDPERLIATVRKVAP